MKFKVLKTKHGGGRESGKIYKAGDVVDGGTYPDGTERDLVALHPGKFQRVADDLEDNGTVSGVRTAPVKRRAKTEALQRDIQRTTAALSEAQKSELENDGHGRNGKIRPEPPKEPAPSHAELERGDAVLPERVKTNPVTSVPPSSPGPPAALLDDEDEENEVHADHNDAEPALGVGSEGDVKKGKNGSGLKVTKTSKKSHDKDGK